TAGKRLEYLTGSGIVPDQTAGGIDRSHGRSGIGLIHCTFIDASDAAYGDCAVNRTARIGLPDHAVGIVRACHKAAVDADVDAASDSHRFDGAPIVAHQQPDIAFARSEGICEADVLNTRTGERL